MRAAKGASPWTSPLDGRVRQHCVFARMPGVFEPCTRLDHLGLITVPCLSAPLSQHRIARKLLGDGSVWILVTSGSLKQLNPELEPAWFPSLCPVVMHSPVKAVYSAYSWIGFFFHHRPRFQSNVRLGIPNRLSIRHCNVWSDGLLR